MKAAIKIGLGLVILLAAALNCAFLAKSKTVRDKKAGMNGSFEISKSGLPVNWLCYTSKTVPSGDFDIVLDSKDAKDGKQSLKFIVRQCSPTGVRLSPGFAQQFSAAPGEVYAISFWARNHGCTFVAKVGGVNAFNGAHQTIAKSSETIESWQRFSTNFTIPPGMNSLRFELNILQPGTFWIDDIRIEKLRRVSVAGGSA